MSENKPYKSTTKLMGILIAFIIFGFGWYIAKLIFDDYEILTKGLLSLVLFILISQRVFSNKSLFGTNNLRFEELLQFPENIGYFISLGFFTVILYWTLQYMMEMFFWMFSLLKF